MNPNEAFHTCERLIDGQEVTVTVKSGRTFRGYVIGAETHPEDALVFETLEKKLRAKWEHVEDVQFRSGRGVASTMMVPPEHPLAGPTNRTGRMKAYTTRHGPGGD